MPAETLTLALLIYFAAEGIFSIMFRAPALAVGALGWLVLNGFIGLFLVGVVLVGVPGTATWMGLLVSIDPVYGGSALIALSLTAHRRKSAMPTGSAP